MKQDRQKELADEIEHVVDVIPKVGPLLHDQNLARQRGKIKAGGVSGYDWFGLGLVAGLGLWMFFLGRWTRRHTTQREYHPGWLWNVFMGGGILLLLFAAIIYLRYTGRL